MSIFFFCFLFGVRCFGLFLICLSTFTSSMVLDVNFIHLLLTFKGFWTMVVYPFYEQVNICLLIHDLNFIYLWILECLSVCSSLFWTLLRDFGHSLSLDIVYSLHACFSSFIIYQRVYGEVFVPSLLYFCFYLKVLFHHVTICLFSSKDGLERYVSASRDFTRL